MNKDCIIKYVCLFVTKIVPILVTSASLTAAVIPRVDAEGNPTTFHKYLDVFALNILNSAHQMGYFSEVDCSEKDGL